MAHCNNCGNQLDEGARFCRSCGAAVAAVGGPSPTVPTGKRTWIPIVIVAVSLFVLVGLAAGAFLLFGGGDLLGARDGAQAEAAADLFEAIITQDPAMLADVLPAEYADDIGMLFQEGALIQGDVVRERVDSAIILTYEPSADAEEEGWTRFVVRIEADGGAERGVVTLTGIEGDFYDTTMIVERDGRRWVVVEMDGMEIGEAFGLAVDEGDGEYDDEPIVDQAGNEAAECWANQEVIESAVWSWLDDNGDAVTTAEDLEGELDEYHVIVGEGYLEIPPTCASDRNAYYYIFDDGTTSCPTGEHGYYLNEQ